MLVIAEGVDTDPLFLPFDSHEQKSPPPEKSDERSNVNWISRQYGRVLRRANELHHRSGRDVPDEFAHYEVDPELEDEEDIYGQIIVEDGTEHQDAQSSRSAANTANNLANPPTGHPRLCDENGNLPAWFHSGSYTFVTTGSKKMPVSLDETHIKETFNRGGGKGGQAINKNKSRCDLTHLPTGIIVRCQAQRSLEMNRRLARNRLSKVLDEGLRGVDSVKQQAEEAIRQYKMNRKKRDRRADNKELKKERIRLRKEKKREKERIIAEKIAARTVNQLTPEEQQR